ncbi:MAG: Uma2 family endonuclease [Chloroflexota bacterium]
MVVQKKLYTIDEYEAFIALPKNAERLFELISGEIVEKVPTQLHGVIAVKTTIRVGGFVEQHNLGYVASEVRHQMPGDEHNARLPDISFYADTTTPLVDRGAVPRMPDLAIEIKSPDDSMQEMSDKADYYLLNGSKMVWLIYPEKRLIEVRTPDDRDLLTDQDILDGGDVLPGFRVTVSELFPPKA